MNRLLNIIPMFPDTQWDLQYGTEGLEMRLLLSLHFAARMVSAVCTFSEPHFPAKGQSSDTNSYPVVQDAWLYLGHAIACLISFDEVA